MSKQKAEKKPKAPPAPKPVEALVLHALKLAATSEGKAKWTGKTAKALFNENEANQKAAIEQCLNAERPLLKQVKDTGTLTAAGFEMIAGELDEEQAHALFERLKGELPEEEVGAVAKVVAGRMPLGARAAFIQDTISRTPLAATELTPLLAETVAAEKAEQEARVAAATKRRAAEEAALKALDRAKELIAELQRNRLESLKREWEAEGQKSSELPVVVTPKLHVPDTTEREADATKREPQTAEDKDFRRDVAKQFAETWRTAWKENKHEARDYLESAMWNVSGLRMIGEAQTRVAFDGRYHECGPAVFTGDQVTVIRPGWVLEEGDRDYVAIKALVEKA